MNPISKKKALSFSVLAALAAVLSFVPEVRANVYATNIKLNGSLHGVTNSTAESITIGYILNEPATLGTTINILSGGSVVDTISIQAGNPGTRLGTNSVVWGGTNSGGSSVGAGVYSVSITPVTSGYTNWTQTSTDSSNTVAVFPHGIAVDNNTNSPYYGRVVVGCSIQATENGVSQNCGFYKANADGSPADEGAFGYAGYTTNDGGATAIGQMPSGTSVPIGNYYVCPAIVRIGEDDRIYWADDSYVGAIVACDILATSNQLVITSGPNGPYGASPGFPNSPNNYGNNPDVGYLDQGGFGIEQFDVVNAGKTNAAIYLVDTGDNPNWGVWMYHLKNGASDPADTEGTQAVNAQGNALGVTGAGVTVDYKQDIFVSQAIFGSGDTNQRTWLFTNWYGGELPPEAGGTNVAEGDTGSVPPKWAVGSSNDYMTGIYDTVINSRSNPTLIAVAMAAGAAIPNGSAGQNGGIRILSATDGSTEVTNLDITNWYYGVAFDNVGNVYGASSSDHYWRVWSPPGTNQATTVAVPTFTIPGAAAPIMITGITVNGTSVTVNFTGSTSASASSFTLRGASTVNGAFSPVPGAVVSLVSPGVFVATATASGSPQFYVISSP